MTWVSIGVAVVGAGLSVAKSDKDRKNAHKEADKQELMAKKADLQAEYNAGDTNKKRKQTDRGSSLLGSTGYSQGSASLIK